MKNPRMPHCRQFSEDREERLANVVAITDRLLKFRLRRKNREKSCFFSARSAVLAGCQAWGLLRCQAGFPRKIRHGLPSPTAC
jgi:hypothetical protein